jgi:membrane carboxypeptidase/penicillin-binding protein
VWAAGFRHPSGGKTGTSNDYRDAWYIGFTRRYTVGVWVGPDEHTPMGPGQSGTDDALPVWMDIVGALHKGTPIQAFERPRGVADVTVCARTGRAAQPFCDSVLYDYRVAAVAKPMPACRPELHEAEEGEEDGDPADLRVRSGEGKETGAFLKRFWNRLKKRL